MKRSKYYISVREEGKIGVNCVSGYIDGVIGVHYRTGSNRGWMCTHIPTGLSFAQGDSERKDGFSSKDEALHIGKCRLAEMQADTERWKQWLRLREKDQPEFDRLIKEYELSNSAQNREVKDV